VGFLQNIRGPELLIILLIIVLLFGAKKLPDTARGLGRSLRIFKAETKGLNEDEAATAASATAAAPAELTQAPAAVAPPPVQDAAMPPAPSASAQPAPAVPPVADER
jgi:sec-independent protein translocase protein TatA